MIKALADQISAIEEGISQHQWPSQVRAILISLITTIREQDKTLASLTGNLRSPVSIQGTSPPSTRNGLPNPSRVTPVSVIRSQKMTKAEAKSLGVDQEVASLRSANQQQEPELPPIESYPVEEPEGHHIWCNGNPCTPVKGCRWCDGPNGLLARYPYNSEAEADALVKKHFPDAVVRSQREQK